MAQKIPGNPGEFYSRESLRKLTQTSFHPTDARVAAFKSPAAVL
jgi:hypothetical protein